MVIKKAVYKTSVISIDKILDDGLAEFAFVGRSNVGKSSLINRLTGKKGLAKASATPGKTKMINYFDINDSFRFVDLPGYGFAKVGQAQKDVWSGLIGQYLTGSNALATVFVLLDIRHTPSELDIQMVEFLIYNQLPFMIVATKADKLAKSKLANQVKVIAKTLGIREEMFMVVSSETGYGIDKILNYIEHKMESNNE